MHPQIWLARRVAFGSRERRFFRSFRASRKCLHHCSRDLWKTHQAKHRSLADRHRSAVRGSFVKGASNWNVFGGLGHLRFSSRSSRMASSSRLGRSSREFSSNWARKIGAVLLCRRGRDCRKWGTCRQNAGTALEGHRQPSVQPPLQAAKSPQMFSPTGGKLDQSRLDVLQSLAGRGPSRVGDLGLGRGSKAPPPPSPFVAGTIEEGEEEDEDDLDGIPLTSGKNVLEKLLASQTLLLEKLASSKAAAQDPLRSLASSSSLDGDDGTKSLGVKGLAARQLLVENFRKHPAKVFQVFQERLTMARRKASKSELESRDLWLHMQESVPLGSHRTLTYVGFQAAAMYEAIERGEWDRVKMLVALQAVFVEQAAYDGGALRLGHLLTGLEDPPFAQTELHRVPKTDLPHGQLSGPRWLTAALGYLKDIESMGEKANRFTRGVNPSQSPQDDSADPAPKIKPKFRPKKPKRGSEGGGEE